MKRSAYGERDHTFGKLMLTLRMATGLTQAGLADLLGVSRHAVGGWESGQSYPKADRVLATLGIRSRNLACCARWSKLSCQSMCDTRTIYTVHFTHMRLSTRLFSPRRGSICAVRILLDQTTRLFCMHALQARVLRWIKPLPTSLVLGTVADLTRGKAELLAENALLRLQLIILHRQIKRPVYQKTDRVLHLVGTLVWQQVISATHVVTWSLFRRSHQARAKAAHYKRRLAASSP